MSARLFFSADSRRLAERLHAGLSAEQRADPLRTPRVILPNRNLRRWLQLTLARPNIAEGAQGVSANVRYHFLEAGLLEALAEAGGMEGLETQGGFHHPRLDSQPGPSSAASDSAGAGQGSVPLRADIQRRELQRRLGPSADQL